MMNAFCKHSTLRGQAGHHGDSRAPFPRALEGTVRGRIRAAKRDCGIVWPISLLLNLECEPMENAKVSMAMGNLASQNKSTRKRTLKNANGV